MTGDRAISMLAPAKINLALAIHGRRPDGFHEISSWVVKLDWGDQLEVLPSDRLTIEVSGAAEGVPTDATNLAYRAAALLAEESGAVRGAIIRLEKVVPHGAGLGGGSSDAAAALLCLNELWKLNWPVERLAELGSRIGSDVPMFLHGASVFISGRGERVKPGPTLGDRWIALVIPPFGIATADVYRKYADRAQVNIENQHKHTPASWEHFARTFNQSTSTLQIAGHLSNDLQSAAFECEPRLAAIHSELIRVGGRPVQMTGSGSCLFCLFDTCDEAEDWRRNVTIQCDLDIRVVVVRTQS